ncbi:hypothetical protein [Urbifossiella limnaea]|uniref:Uncharacterized protein n=1 Tax=Urbifossiella limnaea TaxID=2528023 RepID=A0A517XNH5_9BACT|nr:hypothetical protein [Urbifossiella limnaea]QDU19049.1 hypothetical protein ETAA1_09520 [Urbifossiella limnaea]
MPRALLVLLLAAAAAPAAEPAFAPVAPAPPDALRDTLKQMKARRATLDRLAGPHEPFDLTYLPRPAADVQALLALRPNILLAHPDLAGGGAWLDNVGALLVRMGGGASAGPGLDGLDQLLVVGNATIAPKPDAGDGKTAMFYFAFNSFVARAARPIDWAAAVRTWFPASEVRVHRGYGYRVIRLNFGGMVPGLPTDGTEAVLFPAPDGRTLVADDEPTIKALIERLAERRPTPPPPGWDRVDTAAVAAAVSNRDKQWVCHQPAAWGPELPGPGSRLFRAADHLAAGIDVGPTTRVRFVALAPTQFQAKHVQLGRRDMMERLADRFAPGPGDTPDAAWAALAELTDALLKGGQTTPTPLGFGYAAEAKGDLLGLLVKASKSKAPAGTASAAAALPGFTAAPAPPPPPPAVDPAVDPLLADDIPRTRSPIPGDGGIPGYVRPAR